MTTVPTPLAAVIAGAVTNAKILKNHAWLARFRSADYDNNWHLISPFSAREIARHVNALCDCVASLSAAAEQVGDLNREIFQLRASEKRIYAVFVSEIRDIARRIGIARDPLEVRDQLDALANKFDGWAGPPPPTAPPGGLDEVATIEWLDQIGLCRYGKGERLQFDTIGGDPVIIYEDDNCNRAMLLRSPTRGQVWHLLAALKLPARLAGKGE